MRHDKSRVEVVVRRGYNERVAVSKMVKGEGVRHKISVKHAMDGIKIAFRTQPNFAYHTFFSLVAVALGVILRIGRTEWLVIMVLIVVGMVVEMANTAFESVVDLVANVWHKDAKVAKDVAAGMMLMFALGSVIVALAIFLPYTLALLENLYPFLAVG